jgi:glutamate transport system substrate-binding protein
VVAIKRLPPELLHNSDLKIRFRREAALAARLNEPHIVPIHDYGEIDGQLFIDMRLVEGSDLAVRLTRDGPLSARRAVDIVTQVAAALDAAHAAGLVHRDIKPANVLLSAPTGGSGEFVYVADFGVARAIDGSGTSLTATGAAIGSFDYMAPERFTGGGDHRVDVYALGCLLYETLIAQRPFPGASLPQMIHSHLNVPPPRATQRQPGLPPRLDEVISTAMAKEPDQRYASAGALAAAARDALASPADAVPETHAVPEASPVALTRIPVPDAGTKPPRHADTVIRAEPPRPRDTAAVTTGRPAGRRRWAIPLAVVIALGLTGIGVGVIARTPGTQVASPERATTGAVATRVLVPGSSTFARMQQRGRVTIGVKNDQPGLGMFDPTTSTYNGFDAEIARLTAARLGFAADKIDYQVMPAAAREDAISRGDVDYYVGTYTINANRKQQVSFAGPYYMAGQSLLVRKADSSITGTDTLSGKKVCSVTGSTPIQRVRQQRLTEPENVVELQTYSQCVDRLLSGQVDAVTTDDSILRGYASQQPDALKVVRQPFSAEPYGIGLGRSDAALRAKINDILQAAIDDGTWQRIYDSTLGRSGSPAAPPKLDRY